MPVEAEVKARVRDVGTVRARLRQLADEQASVYRDTYYDLSDRELTSEGRELRVRVVEDSHCTRTLLTYKAPAVDIATGSKPEHETSAASADTLDAILTGLGFVHLVEFEKHCLNYMFTAHGRAIQATLVTVPELDGTFIEIETLADEDDVRTALHVVRNALAELGVRDDDLTTEQYTDAVMRRRGTT